MAENPKKPDAAGEGGPVSLEDRRRLKKAVEADWVAEQLRWAEICNRRADVRNGLRGFVERSRRLSEIFGVTYVPAVTANEIRMEEDERRERVVRETAHDECGAGPGETFKFRPQHEIYADREQIRRSEHAKYIGTKFALLLEKCAFTEARAFIEKMRLKTKGKLPEQVEKELVFRMARFYAECIREYDTGAMIEAYMELGVAVKVGREDLFEVTDAQVNDEALLKRLGNQMAGFSSSGPDIFERMKRYFEEIGLKTGRK